MGTSSGVLIKRGVEEAIGAATPMGKGKEKKIVWVLFFLAHRPK